MGMFMFNVFLLDEGIVVVEVMIMCSNIVCGRKKMFLVVDNCYFQIIEVCRMWVDGLGLNVVVVDYKKFDYSSKDVSGVLVQYFVSDGVVYDYLDFIKNVYVYGVKVVMVIDLLLFIVLMLFGELGVDMVVGFV